MIDRQVISGTVIKRSNVKTVGLLIAFVIVTVIGFAILISILQQGVQWHNLSWQDFIDKKWWLVCLGWIIGPLGILTTVGILRSRERLIVGDDRLQKVIREAGQDVVAIELMYDNIAVMHCLVSDGLIGIDFVDPEQVSHKKDFEQINFPKHDAKWHYVFENSYRMPVLELHTLIREAMAAKHGKDQINAIAPKGKPQPLVARVFYRILVWIMFVLLGVLAIGLLLIGAFWLLQMLGFDV